MRIPRTLLFLALALIFLVPSNGAQAWEFSMTGAMEWRYEYYAQQGTQGFFGPYDVSNEPGVPVRAQSNAWLGIETLGSLFHGKHAGVVTGSDASRSVILAEFFPKILVNKAVSLHAKYRIGGHGAGNDDMLDGVFDDVGSGFNNEYVNSLVPGQNNAFAFGDWTMMWVDVRTPWGIVSYGKKPFPVGCGLSYNGDDATEESLLLVVPYGPMQFGFGFYPMTLGQVDFFDIRRRQQAIYFNLVDELPDYYGDNAFWDESGHPIKMLAFVQYAAGSMSMGLGTQYTKVHLGSEGRPREATPNWPTIDQADFEGWLYTKYNNGRFFFNAEVDFFYRDRRILPTLNGTIAGAPPPPDGGGSIFAAQYVKSWRYMLETGFFAGPMKFSFLYAFLPGPDRRHGVLIDRQPTTYPYEASSFPRFNTLAEETSFLNRHVGNSGVFRPYSLLLSYNYGAGVNCYDLNGNGCMTDASVLAARLDFAVAANLNVYGSFLYAERASHGWQFGSIRPAAKRLSFVPRQSFANEFDRPIPTVPDTALGWEIDFGADWQILDQWLFSLTGAYWQPGRWFNFACVDRSVPNWIFPSPGNGWGINPDRVIDAIWGFEMVTSVTF